MLFGAHGMWLLKESWSLTRVLSFCLCVGVADDVVHYERVAVPSKVSFSPVFLVVFSPGAACPLS